MLYCASERDDSMKTSNTLITTLALAILLSACGTTQTTPPEEHGTEIEICLSDSEIKVNGVSAGTNMEHGVSIGNDIVYYEEGKDFTYGEGTQEDAHSSEAAAGHTVVHINRPGSYRVSGTLSKGQIAVDLGKEAKDDPNAVVTLILDGADITCEVAPAVIFYNVYECGSADAETATKDEDTSAAGANVIIADGSVNTVRGSYVARIYKPESVVLNEDGTEVEQAKKLHKYDAAFYSRMSMNVDGEAENSGMLTIYAENEGLDSELHLTINGGITHIYSGNDGINTNEDGVSVTTVNGGEVHIQVTGETGEGDGIDSNGWLVINGGTVTAQACASSMDGGIDSDMGIHLNGGTVVASGHMLDRISESEQTYAVLNFGKFLGAGTYSLKNAENESVWEQKLENDFTSLVVSTADLVEGDYTLWYEHAQLVGTVSEHGGGVSGGGMPPAMGDFPGGMTPPDGFDPGQGRPDMGGMTPPEGFVPGEGRPGMDGMAPPEGWNGKMEPEQNEDGAFILPNGDVIDPKTFSSYFEGGTSSGRGPGGFGGNLPNEAIELSEIFPVKQGANYFSFISLKE